ncbi:MAG: ACT domain-containing protein [Deltaproteobacteria bacterium]|nr:ACT domain-containing protein [Deltaproteobacteria bacterium]
MVAYQLSIIAENRPGGLGAITSKLKKENINIRAITIANAGDFGVVNMIVDDPNRAYTILAKTGFTVNKRAVMAVVIEDKPGGLDRLIEVLAQAKINVENAYGFVLESWKKAVFVVDVKEIERAQEVLKREKFEILDMDELSKIEPFHYMKY